MMCSIISVQCTTQKMRRQVVVTGLGVIAPLGDSVPAVWSRLLSGDCSTLAVLDSLDPRLPCRIAGRIPDELLIANGGRWPRFVALAVQAARAAYADSGLAPGGPRTGVSIGVGMASLDALATNWKAFVERGPRRMSPYFVPDLLVNMATAHVSMDLGVQGPSLSPSTACASGAHAIGDAARLIACDSADVMIAGGAEACIHDLAMAGFAQCRALSTGRHPQTASRPWSASRSGFVMAEGAAMVVLEEEQHAIGRGAEILARVAGYGMSSDAYHVVAPSPDGRGARIAMEGALRDAQMTTDEIGLVNAHATSTQLGDLAEALAIESLFGDRVPVVSLKGQTGHLLGAAGALEAVASVMALRTRSLPPNVNLDDPDPDIAQRIQLPTSAASSVDIPAVLSNSFGFGGTNVSLLFTRS
ncbi:hypothetical protein PBRA_006029 [Plasmodiophora brassicae]|uniref:beta-ketoacyl-[acyl-carrier-protein] synthase I n=1 Tax=Plasmodiophora brassicae TaxID=37360 RepID=A0A0G4IRL9_PLABS|nr:hypothetical protein PBRA_006029 [Plasmodiophora brassicae]